MSESDLATEELIARIRRGNAETAKLLEETRKFVAEQHKLDAEARKLHRDRWLAPVLAVTAMLGALAAAGGVFGTYLLHLIAR